jgi:hypothetical protein
MDADVTCGDAGGPEALWKTGDFECATGSPKTPSRAGGFKSEKTFPPLIRSSAE